MLKHWIGSAQPREANGVEVSIHGWTSRYASSRTEGSLITASVRTQFS
jgi:hypothetical protein